MRRYLFTGIVAVIAALLFLRPVAAEEDINTIKIRSLLSNEASAWNRGRAGTILSSYASSFAGYSGKRSNDPRKWEVTFSSKEEFKDFVEKRLSSMSYSVERRVLYINYRGDRAICLTRDSGKTTYKETGQERSFERYTLWTLVKEDDEWKVTSFIFDLALPEEEEEKEG